MRGGSDLIAQGMGGIMHVTGEPDGPPISVGLPICDLGTGMWAVQGILAALYERQRTGLGRLVECSLLETAIGFSSWTSAQWLADHEEPTPGKERPHQRMNTKDGYLMAAPPARRSGNARQRWGTRNVQDPRSRLQQRCETAPHSKPRSRRCSPPQPASIGGGAGAGFDQIATAVSPLQTSPSKGVRQPLDGRIGVGGCAPNRRTGSVGCSDSVENRVGGSPRALRPGLQLRASCSPTLRCATAASCNMRSPAHPL